MDNRDFCRTLKRLRNENGRTQEWVANKIGVTRPTYLKWENGQTIPDINAVCRIADLFNISLDELTSRDIDKKETTYKTYADIFKALFSCNLGIKKFSFCKGNIVITSVYSSWIQIYELYKNGSVTDEVYNMMCNSIINEFKNIKIVDISKGQMQLIIAPYLFDKLSNYEPCSLELIIKILKSKESDFFNGYDKIIDKNSPEVVNLYKRFKPYIIETWEEFKQCLEDISIITLPFNF